MDAASFFDPECTKLHISEFELYDVSHEKGIRIDTPHNLDGWRTLGKQIGEHKKLWELTFCGRFEATAESLEALLRGIAQNRSVRELYFLDCRGNWPLGILAPFYKNLHKLTVEDCHLSRRAIRSLSAALRGCTDCSLESIEWYRFDLTMDDETSVESMDDETSVESMDDETSVEFIQSLAGLSRLNFLRLVACNIGPRGCNAMAALLRSPDCTLKDFWFGHKRIKDEGLDALAAGLRDNRTVTDLCLDHFYHITIEAWQSFASILSIPTCMLECLNLEDSDIDNDAMVAFANALRGNSRLKCLRLSSYSISSINWAQVFGGEQMNRKISPHVLAWLGYHGWGEWTCTAVYGFLRKMPTLWGNSCWVVRRSGRKRKAQS